MHRIKYGQPLSYTKRTVLCMGLESTTLTCKADVLTGKRKETTTKNVSEKMYPYLSLLRSLTLQEYSDIIIMFHNFSSLNVLH